MRRDNINFIESKNYATVRENTAQNRQYLTSNNNISCGNKKDINIYLNITISNSKFIKKKCTTLITLNKYHFDLKVL
jgi:hypothetical protein